MPDLRFGANDVIKAYLGSSEAVRVYLGSTLLLDNTASVRHPYRPGGTGTGKELVRASDLTAYTETTGVYTQLTVEDWVLTGAPVGQAVMWDDVAADAFSATVVGLPGTQRDAGYSGFTTSDWLQSVDFGAAGALHLEITKADYSPAANERLVVFANAGTGTGWLIAFISGNLTFGRYITGTLQGTLQTITIAGAYDGTRLQIIATENGGNMILRVYDAAGSLLYAASQTGGSSVSGPGSSDVGYFGAGGTLNPFPGTIHRIRTYAALTLTQSNDAAAGTGSPPTPIADLTGLRTGTYNELATAELPIESGAGADVLAQ